VDSITVDLGSRFCDSALNTLSKLSFMIPASILHTDGHESVGVGVVVVVGSLDT